MNYHALLGQHDSIRLIINKDFYNTFYQFARRKFPFMKKLSLEFHFFCETSLFNTALMFKYEVLLVESRLLFGEVKKHKEFTLASRRILKSRDKMD
jgi:hypothetical protein